MAEFVQLRSFSHHRERPSPSPTGSIGEPGQGQVIEEVGNGFEWGQVNIMNVIQIEGRKVISVELLSHIVRIQIEWLDRSAYLDIYKSFEIRHGESVHRVASKQGADLLWLLCDETVLSSTYSNAFELTVLFTNDLAIRVPSSPQFETWMCSIPGFPPDIGLPYLDS